MVAIYHHLSDGTDPLVDQLTVTTRPDLFLRQVRQLARSFDLISFADLLAGRLPPRPLLITFDDAYRSVVEIGGPILKSLNAPSVFFLNAGTVTGDTLPLDNVLSLAVSELGLQEVLSRLGIFDLRVRAAGGLLTRHAAKLTAAATNELKCNIAALLGTTTTELRRESALFMGEPDVKKLAAFGMAVGNHSISHPFFRALSVVELEREIGDSRAILERISGLPVLGLSIPYGHENDAGRPVLEIARRTGHQAIFLVHDRSNRFRREPDVFYRTNPRNTPSATLPARMRLVPLMRSIWHSLM
jgi:peptidoglycan/xylan/chitin deacetylase (PgdA/CDA1 family)